MARYLAALDDRDQLPSSAARHFGAARDSEQCAWPFLISGAVARGGHGWSASVPDTSRDSGAGPVAPGPPGPCRGEARAQRLRQAGGTACHLLSPVRPENLMAPGLRPDQVLERIAVAVTVDAGLEVRGHRADQGCGRPELTGRDVDVVAEEGELRYAHLIGAEQSRSRT